MTDLWGSRFAEPLADEMRRFSSSYAVDHRLALYDLIGSKAHAHALHDAGILDRSQLTTLLDALDQVADEVRDGTFAPDNADGGPLPEDVHSAVETRLVELCGEIGKRLHAGRSRNDQVVTDMLLWLRDASHDIESAVRQLQQVLVLLAEQYQELVVPSYTHLQRAQPVSLAHQLLAHFEGLDRDVGRLSDARARADRCPLGAGTGTSIPIDRRVTAARLGFSRVATNSVDAVADRDWAIEFVSACALIMTHLSRLAEELILWSAVEFGVARIGDAFCTGSSMMPQKRNPDAAELVRGKTARVTGDLQTLLTLLKGLPLGYNRDLQEDKEALFDAADTTRAALGIMASMLRSTEFQAPAARGPDFMGATDLEWAMGEIREVLAGEPALI